MSKPKPVPKADRAALARPKIRSVASYIELAPNAWPENARRHRLALINAGSRPFAGAILGMFTALRDYAAAHDATVGDPIGSDGVLGPEWLALAAALRALLNGDTGGLDGATMAGAISSLIRDAGFPERDQNP